MLSEDARKVLVLQTAGDIVSSTLQMKKVWSSCKALHLLVMYHLSIRNPHRMLPNYLIMFLCRQQYQNKTIIIFLLKIFLLARMYAWRESYQTFSRVHTNEGSDFKAFSSILMLCPELHKFPFMSLHSAICKMGRYH